MPSPNPSGSNPYEQIYQSALNVKKKMPSIKAEEALRQKNYDQAVKEFTELIKTNPSDADFHANLAVAQYNLRKYDEAISAIDAAIKLKPSGDYENMKKTILAVAASAVLAVATLAGFVSIPLILATSVATGLANALALICFTTIGMSLTSGLSIGVAISVGVAVPMVLKASGMFASAPGPGSTAGMALASGIVGDAEPRGRSRGL